MIKSVAPPPQVCTNMYNRKLQFSASIKKVTKLHIHHLDNFFKNVWLNSACKGLGQTSELLPCSLSLSNQYIHCILKTKSNPSELSWRQNDVINWFVGEGVGMRFSFSIINTVMLNRIPVTWLQGECECPTESMKWLLNLRSCKLLNGIFSIYAVYSCLWVGENHQANKKSNKKN